MQNKTVCISGYFDPLHVGHLEYIKLSKNLVGPNGKLIVIVNSDHQAQLKKGKYFMPCKERIEILKAIKYVDEVIESIDTDRTVCKTLEQIKPDYFCNGGDQFNDNIPEAPICQKLNIQLVDSLGLKIQSSSWLTGLTSK
jgi:cytidyltransferase-like protein